MNKYLEVLSEKDYEGEGCLEGCLNGCFSGCGCLIGSGSLFVLGVYGVYNIVEYFLN